MTEKLFDVIIIGGGPAGLSAAQYAARANLSTLILDKSPLAGALAYTDKIENYPGFIEPVSGKELLEIFRNQAIKFGAEYIETQVVAVTLEGDIKEIQAMEQVFNGKTVVIATGSMGRKPSIQGEEKFLGKGVSYCAVCDAAFFRDQTVCVIGDSEEAVKEAEMLTEFAGKVYMISPSNELKISADMPPLNHEKVSVITGHKVIAIDGDEFVTDVRIKNIDTGTEQDIVMDGVFVYLHGSKPIIDFLDSSVSLSEQECVMTHRTMQTSIPGVFAAGDVTCAEVRQVVVAAGFGCIAALSAEKYIRQRKRMRYDWVKK